MFLVFGILPNKWTSISQSCLTSLLKQQLLPLGCQTASTLLSRSFSLLKKVHGQWFCSIVWRYDKHPNILYWKQKYFVKMHIYKMKNSISESISLHCIMMCEKKNCWPQMMRRFLNKCAADLWKSVLGACPSS